MNNVIKSKWVEALRSGEYKQGQGRLNDRDLFCCLGVLCEVLIKDEDAELNSLIKNKVPCAFDLDCMSYDNDSKVVPNRVRLAADLSVRQVHDLISRNDSGFTFEQIAEYIEENL